MHRVTRRAIQLLSEIASDHVQLAQKHRELMSLAEVIPPEDYHAYAAATQKIIDGVLPVMYKRSEEARE